MITESHDWEDCPAVQCPSIRPDRRSSRLTDAKKDQAKLADEPARPDTPALSISPARAIILEPAGGRKVVPPGLGTETNAPTDDERVTNDLAPLRHTLRVVALDLPRRVESSRVGSTRAVVVKRPQPIADQATVATHMVARLARQHVKMVLTGEGGDELFAGYARYEGEQLSRWTRYWPGALGKCVRRAATMLPLLVFLVVDCFSLRKRFSSRQVELAESSCRPLRGDS